MSFPPQDRKEVERGENRSWDYQVSRLLTYLGEEGCPICRETSGSDERYFFWFFHENYGTIETLDALTRSLGFCPAHGARAALNPAGQSSLAVVHEVLARRIGSILSREVSGGVRRKNLGPALAAIDRCPACRYREEAVALTVSFLASALNDPSGMDHYGSPGLLCFPHLQTTAPRLSEPALRRVLNLHESAAASILVSLTKLRGGTSEFSSLERNDLDGTLLSALRLVAEDDKRHDIYPTDRISGASPTARDPVGDFLETLFKEDACPVCIEVRRSWTEWMEWLEDAIPRGWEVKDVLPVCPEHVRAAVYRGNAPLAVESVRKMIGAVLDQVRLGIEDLSSLPIPDRGPALQWLGNTLWGSRKRFRSARNPVVRPLNCPLCHRLAVARDRILALLFALIEAPHHRAGIERGYGLCLRHFSRAMALRPPPVVRVVLSEVEATRLGCLQWELEESLRKDAWMYRPEAPGTEHTAWKRGVLRFSGFFPGQEGWTRSEC